MNKLFNSGFGWKGWQIGTWSTPISISWKSQMILRHYGIRFDCKFNTVCFGRLEIRIWKPKFMRCGAGIVVLRDMRKTQGEDIAPRGTVI